MPKRKKADGDDLEGDPTVPLPIQSFLWRQTNPFIRPKLGKLCEASCLSFERVLVQNILHGISPSLCEAIQNMSRWKLITSAFPHVMHCAATCLSARKATGIDNKFDSNETKLLYTLHWIILDAASECEDMEQERFGGNAPHASYLFSIDNLQLFVYLFAPIIQSMKEQHFQTLKLENGLRLWQSLWAYRQPDVPCYCTPVKPKRNILKANHNTLRVNFNAANIYVGKGTSHDNIYLGFEDAPSNRSSMYESSSPQAPLAHLSDICAMSSSTTQSATVEIICEVCNSAVQSKNGETSCKCGVRRASYASFMDPRLTGKQLSLDKESVAKKLEAEVNGATPPMAPPCVDVLSASYFDVAVMRNLFTRQWQEDGYYWALRYIHQRLLDICDERQRQEYSRERSKSLPTPDTNHARSPPVSPTPHTPPSPRNVSPDLKQPDSIPPVEPRKEPSFKRMKQIFEGKVNKLRRRESCEQFDLDVTSKPESGRVSPGKPESGRASPEVLTADQLPSRPNSALARLRENEEDGMIEDDLESGDSTDAVRAHRRKSLPHIRRGGEKYDEEEEEEEAGRKPLLTKENISRLRPDMQKPIITITEDSPSPTPSPSWLSKRESLMSERSDYSHRPLMLQRSLTDSNISYGRPEEVEEVPGSIFYITDSGEMNYLVILKAAYFIANRECSARMCGVLLNILNCLFDIGIIEEAEQKNKTPPSKKEKSGEGKKKEKKEKEKEKEEDDEKEKKKNAKDDVSKESVEVEKRTNHSTAMDTVIRLFRIIGCPHGCGDGFRGNIGDHLRNQGLTCLSRLHKINTPLFRRYLKTSLIKQPLQDIMDFLHGLLGFCVDPCANPMSPQGTKKEGGKTGYVNNFGEPIGGGDQVQQQIVFLLLKPLVSRFVQSRKEMQGHENLDLYCDVRQFMNYVKEVKGGTFRRVALSGLSDALDKNPVEKVKPRAKIIRRTLSMTSESGNEREKPNMSPATDDSGNAKSRRSLFRRKTKKQILPTYGGASDSEILEEPMGKLSPRVSMSEREDEPPSGSSTPKRKFSKFNLAWKRAAKSDHEDEGNNMDQLDYRRERNMDAGSGGSPSKDPMGTGPTGQRPKARMSFKAASQATLSFLSARKRIEDGLKNWSKRRHSKRGSIDEEGNRRGSLNPSDTSGTEVVVIRERRLVDAYAVKSGMLRFNFMLDCCQPGSIPDPHLIAALLDLEAPVVARSALLLECAHFVNRCNHGDWPNWMKLNLPGFRQTGLLHSRGQPSGYRRNIILQRTAGRLFHMWGEAMGNRLYDIMNEETPDKFTVIHQVKDDNKKRELRTEDEEEDYMDEATVNHTGSDCPYSLKLVACQLLLEITTFLRETYQYIPKAKLPRKDTTFKDSSSRRWSVLNSPGPSERSNSRSSQGDVHRASFVGSPSDRKISFAVTGQAERSDSIHSSTTSISMSVAEGMSVDGKGRRMTSKGKLLKMRRGSGHNASFNRSFKMKRGDSLKRSGSVKTRKVSTQSLRSDSSDLEQREINEADSGGMMSDENQDQSPDDVEEQDYSTYMPWIKVVVQLANTSNFICDHQSFCHPNCYERQRRSCTRLMTAIKKVYDSEPEDKEKQREEAKKEEKKENFRDKMKRRESMFQPSSPTRRRESTPLLEKINLKQDINAARAKIAAALEKCAKEQEPKKPKKAKDESAMMKYLRTQVQSLTQSPMSIISKAAPILAEDTFIDMLPVAWELLLENDQELAAAAATVFILSSVKANDQVQELMMKELQHEEVGQRINAILRFNVLWRFRYQVWPRMEDGAQMFFKVPPPSIDFVLPSPTVGMPCLHVIDPPWMPHFKTKVEEVTINQEESKTFVTATTTRRKQQQEMIHRALLAEEDRRRAAREHFHMTSVPITQQAAYEPGLHHVGEEHEEAVQLQEEMNLAMAARRMSVAPLNRASTAQVRNLSWRSASIFWPRSTGVLEGEEERVEHIHHMQLAQHFFPSCVCAAVPAIVHLLEDTEVSVDGVAVSEVAVKVSWSCLVEEPALFLRTFLEKLTNRDRKDELIYLLRKLTYHIPELPAQAAHTLFNYLVGYIMFYVRSPVEGGQESIGEALSVLWQIVPSVQGIFFKDLKQTLRKEQCDCKNRFIILPMLMITANVPSAKKLLVHGTDLTGIPSQYHIHEDTQFESILEDSLDFFNIPDEEHNCHFLVDTKTNQMHNLNSYVRDFYFFRRNVYPQLSLVKMNPEEASRVLQRQALILKFVEMGKVIFCNSIIQSSLSQTVQNHVSFLHEELIKLPSFPRKALEAEFGLYKGQLGEQLYGVDMLHKYVWIKLMSLMFRAMSSTLTTGGDLPLFLNVVNGAVLLHSEDTAVMRKCVATLINASQHFKQVFSTTGFLYIMPTMMKVYSNHQCNTVLTGIIEFACRQFYTLHRKPFMLQLFGSVAPILHIDEDEFTYDYTKVHPKALFFLLKALEQPCPDQLDILELVDGEKPLTALDFCYHDDPDTFTMVDAINMCITVIAFACDSHRAQQMLVILNALLPYHLKDIRDKTTKKDNSSAAREEINMISTLAVSIRALVISAEVLSRNFSGPQQRHLETKSNIKATANHNHSPQGPSIYYDEQSEINASYRYMEEGKSNRRATAVQESDTETNLSEFRKPRNLLLGIVAHFFSHCSSRIKELRKMLADPTFRMPELLDHKSHNRLADIAHTLLKVAAYDPVTMACTGLQRYMLEIVPITDWSQESVRPAINFILRRLERSFTKFYKKPALRRNLDWEASANLLKGLYNALAKFPFIAHLPHLKTLINVCLNILLSDDAFTGVGDSSHNIQPRNIEPVTNIKICVPPTFCSAVVKLTAMQMQALGSQYTLEHICGGMSVFPSSEKTISMLVNLILPLAIRMGCGRRDCPKMRQADIQFALTILLHALVPPSKSVAGGASSGPKMQHLSVADMGRTGSVTSAHKNHKALPKENVLEVVFLGLKILMVCFEKQLATEWNKIAKVVQDLGNKLLGGLALWRFMDFVVSVRTPLFMLLQPFIQYRMMKAMCETEQEYFLQHLVHQKLQGHNMGHPKCKASILIELASELRLIREDLMTAEMRSRSSTVTRSDGQLSKQGVVQKTASVSDLLEQQVTARLQSLSTRPPGARYLPTLSSALSAVAAPMIAQPGRSRGPPESPSPALARKRGQRIFAQEGSRILEKYFKKPSLQEDDEQLPDATLLRATSPRKLQRQASIFQRAHITKQLNVCGTPPDEAQLSDSFPHDPPSAFTSLSLDDEDSATSTRGTPMTGSPDHEAPPRMGADGSLEYDPRSHRLQRADAKSRKTFKIKRHRSTIKGSILRSATVKGTMKVTTPPVCTPSNGTPIGSCERLETQLEEIDDSETAEGGSSQSPVKGASGGHVRNTSDGHLKRRIGSAGRKRFVPRSKSHDEGSSTPASRKKSAAAGTARGRIERSGARLMKSRSPSTSPGRPIPREYTESSPPSSITPSPQESPAHARADSSPPSPTTGAASQAYVMKCDSIESLSNEENLALLTSEDKSKSTSSLLIFFDGTDVQDTCV